MALQINDYGTGSWDADAALARAEKRIAELEAEIARLREAVDSAGEWISQAKIATEPGWAGSQGYILEILSAASGRGAQS